MAFIPKTTTNPPHHSTGNRKQLQKPLHPPPAQPPEKPSNIEQYTNSPYTPDIQHPNKGYTALTETPHLFFSPHHHSCSQTP